MMNMKSRATLGRTLTPILSGLATVVALAWLAPILLRSDRSGSGLVWAQQDGLAPNSEAGLVGRWPFDEGAGTNTADVSGNGRAGTLQGNPLPIWTSGVSSNALGFDGLQNRVEVPDDAGLSPTNALTLATWVKAATNITSEAVAKWTTNGPDSVGVKLAPIESGLGGYMLSLTNGYPSLELTLDGVYAHLVGALGLADTNWHHMAGHVRRRTDGSVFGRRDEWQYGGDWHD